MKSALEETFAQDGPALIAVPVGAALLVLGKHWRYPRIARLGLLCAALGLLALVIEVIGAIDLGNWLTLAGLGAWAIIAGSVLERHGAYVAVLWKSWIGQSQVAGEQGRR